MWMGIAAINFQLPVNAATETIVRNHSSHRALDEQFRVARPSRPYVLRLVSSHVTGKAHETFLFFLFSGHAHFFGVDHDNEIAGIDVRGENRFLFSAQK